MQKWGGAVLQISALKLQQFCVKPFVGHANLTRCRYWRLEERRDGAASRVVGGGGVEGTEEVGVVEGVEGAEEVGVLLRGVGEEVPHPRLLLVLVL